MLSHRPLLLARLGITKPKFRMFGGYWECTAAKDGKSSHAYGETPEQAWRWWKFYQLNHAPPTADERRKKAVDNG